MTRKTIVALFLIFLAAQGSWGQSSIPKVVMNYVSVDPATNDVEISWVQSNDIDVKGYIIYRDVPGTPWYLSIDTVKARNITTFINYASPITATSSMAGTKSETYNVIAFDSITNEKSEHSDDHHTIFLESAFRPCYAEIKLNWTAYDTWFNGISNYNIYYNIDGGAWDLLEVVDGYTVNYNVHNLLPDVDYSFYIEAVSGGVYMSTSNQVTEFTDMPVPPVDFNANYASVSAENYIDLSFTIDTAADVTKYVLLRSDSLDGDFESIMEFTPGASETLIEYTDYTPTSIIHYYKLQAINTCDVPFANTTNYCSNIVLNANALNNMRNKLIWNNYYKWDRGISHYDVYRVVDYMNPVNIAQIPYGDTVHLDRMDQFLYDPQSIMNNTYLEIENPYNYLEQPIVSGLVCYYVIGIEKPGVDADTLPLPQYESKSNKVCVSQMPRVFVPNAFSPNSDDLNDTFFPYISFAGLADYELRIYNRWGNLVFRTLHIHQGWNGTMFDGSTKAPIGTYVYQFSFIDGEGESQEHTGQVTLIR